MTGRERVYKTLCGEKADRMPIDFGVHFSTGISIFAYQNLRAYLGLSTDHIELVDPVQCLARVDDDILDRFHVDTVLLNPPFQKTHIWKPREHYSFLVPDGFDPTPYNGGFEIRQGEHRMYMPEGGFFFDGDWLNFGNQTHEEWLSAMARRAEYLYKETDRFTMLMGFPAYFDGIEHACDMLTDPEQCAQNSEAVLADQIARFDEINARFGRYIQAIEVNSDLGTQQGLMCTPDSYEALCAPYLKRFCRHVHETSDIKIFMHSCGSIIEAIPAIIDAGVDALNPIQISARGMDPAVLKEKFGGKICFWGGGCDTQTVLPNATPQEVAEHVKKNISILGKDGGLVFNQVHNIMGNVPPENIVAMFDTAYACSGLE